MLYHTQTDHYVKGIVRKWNFICSCLSNSVILNVADIIFVCFHSIAEVNGVHHGAAPNEQLSKTSRAAAYFQNSFSFQICKRKTQAPFQAFHGNVHSGMAVKLRLYKR